MAKKYLRKKAVRERYGNVCDRTIERAVKERRLPPPEFPFGNKIPAWSEQALDENDRAAALNRRPDQAA